MRIIMLGQGDFGAESFKNLIKQGEEVVGVITVPDQPDQKKPNPLKEAVQEEDVPILLTENLKGNDVYEWVKGLFPDLLVLTFVTSLVPQSIVDLAKHGGINYHPSLLPKYRGGTAMNWTIIYGEKETGVTIHYIDAGIDTGDIILQEKVAVDPEDNVASLYFNKLYPLGIKLIPRAVKLIREGNAPRIPQDHSKGSYQPLITEKDVIIDWRKSTEKIYNLIRGSSPMPGATTFLNGAKLKIWEAKPIYEKPPANREPGEVVEAIKEEGFKVVAGDGLILAKRIQFPNTKKIPATEAIASASIKEGDKLASNGF